MRLALPTQKPIRLSLIPGDTNNGLPDNARLAEGEVDPDEKSAAIERHRAVEHVGVVVGCFRRLKRARAAREREQYLTRCKTRIDRGTVGKHREEGAGATEELRCHSQNKLEHYKRGGDVAQEGNGVR